MEKELKKKQDVELEGKGYVKVSSKRRVNEEFKQELEEKQNEDLAKDSRFTRLFEDEDYAIDKHSEQWKRLHPSQSYQQQQ